MRRTKHKGIYKVRDGVYQVRVSVKVGVDENGKGIYKEKAKNYYGDLDGAIAMKVALTSRYKGIAPTSGRKSLNNLCERYLEYCEVHLSPSTLRNYRSIYRTKVKDAIGWRYVDDVYPDDLDRYFASLEVSGRTANQVRAFLSGTFRQGVRWGWAGRNPIADTTPMKVAKFRPNLPRLESIEAVLGYFKASKAPEIGDALFVCWLTQMRRGELCGLKASSWDGETLWVKGTITIGDGGVLSYKNYTKNGEDRSFQVVPEVAAVLDRYAKNKIGDAFLFSDDGGATPWNPQRITRAFDRAKKKLGLNFRVHDLRAYTTTLMVKAGMSKEAQVYGGWKDEATMRRHYNRLTPGGNEAVIALLSSQIGGSSAYNEVGT